MTLFLVFFEALDFVDLLLMDSLFIGGKTPDPRLPLRKVAAAVWILGYFCLEEGQGQSQRGDLRAVFSLSAGSLWEQMLS